MFLFQVANLQIRNLTEVTHYSHDNRNAVLLIIVFVLSSVTHAAPFLIGLGTLKGISYYICYLFPNLISMWETTLILKLINGVQKKFLSINNLIDNRKRQHKNLRKVFSQNVFINRNISNIIQTHYNTTMVSKRIGDIFEFPTLITLTSNLLSLTFTLHYIVMIFKTIRNTTPFFMATAATLWLITLGIQTILIVRGFENLRGEVKLYRNFN